MREPVAQLGEVAGPDLTNREDPLSEPSEAAGRTPSALSRILQGPLKLRQMLTGDLRHAGDPAALHLGEITQLTVKHGESL